MALVNEGRAGAAATALQTSPGNLRRMVNQLESWAGAPLCQSGGGGEVKPTTMGRKLMEGYPSLMEACREFQAKVDRIHHRGRLLRVGVDEGLFRSRLFGRVVALLRRDGRFRPVPVRADSSGLSSLESGASDLLISTVEWKGRRTSTRVVGRFGLSLLSHRWERREAPRLQDVSERGLYLSPAVSEACGSRLSAECRTLECGACCHRLAPAEFVSWRESGGERPFCAVVDNEVDLNGFEGSVHPFPGEFLSTLTVTRLLNHPYPFLEEVTGRLAFHFGPQHII